jgi:hypothetical protein
MPDQPTEMDMRPFHVLPLILAGNLMAPAWPQGQDIQVVPRPAAGPANEFYVGNRAPLLPSPLVKLPIGAIQPQGWLRKQLDLEADGFSGRLTEISEFLKKDGNAWLSKDGLGTHGWEEVPYWLKGFGDLGYVLNDPRIIAEARTWIDAVLASQREDGYFGPRANLTAAQVEGSGKPDVWPNMIMLNALQSFYEYTAREGEAPAEPVLKLMTNYFRWELNLPEADFLLPFWQQQRAADNLASVYWLYNRTGEPWLLDLAEKIHRRMADWTSGVANWHGVNIAQAFRGSGNYYVQSKDPRHLQAVERNYQEVRGSYGQVPGGLYGSDENCRPGYSDPRQGTETCTMAEMMLSCETLLGITGDGLWADRCEDVAFNSLPASMTADLKALHYLTAPNLVRCDRANKAPDFENGGDMLSFNPHQYRCCQHNVAHAWPYFAEHLWMATPGNGLAAVLYAPCQVKAKVGNGTEVTITADTIYPFADTIEFTLATAKPVQFPLYLRVPGWCTAPAVEVNGANQRPKVAGPAYLVLDRTWADGDKVTLCLPMHVNVTTWEKNNNSVSINRGPLTYALKIGEQYVRAGGTDAWPGFELLPTTPWNYGLILDDQQPDFSLKIARGRWPESNQPFTPDAVPIQLQARAKKIPAWQEDKLGVVGPLQPSPAKSDQPEETVTLIPMGCARLRIASFPTVDNGPKAHEWTPPAGQAAADYPVRPVPFTAVQINDEFWSPRLETNRTVTIPYDFRKCEETGRLDNFLKAAHQMPGKYEGYAFNDSDVFKVVEGAAYSLALHPDPELDKYLDGLIAKIAAAQEPDGYLYAARTVDPASVQEMSGKERFSSLRWSHELYNLGHLYEAAVAHYQATGKRTLLHVALRSADFIDREFGPGQRCDPPGHQEIEIGLVKLYRVTGQDRYLKLAKFFLDQRGRNHDRRESYEDYAQDHQPVTEQDHAVGHSVRATYMYSGMADVAALTGDDAYIRAIDRIWQNMVAGRLYLTGGIGSRSGGEAFGDDFELPNQPAYAETCASIANILWNQRMFLLHGDAQYIDVLERVLYNGFLSGVALSGDSFFYANPLASSGDKTRKPWFDCSCCPTNVVRFMPSIPGYVYAQRDRTIYVNLFIAGRGKLDVGGQTIALVQETRYPWDGDVRIRVESQKAAEFALYVRIPGWATGHPIPSDLYRFADAAAEPVTLKVNGTPTPLDLDKGYARLQRTWQPSDVVELHLPMPIQRIVANPQVKDDADRVALQRGPIVYCAEAVDNGGHVSDLILADDVTLSPRDEKALLGGVTTLRGPAQRVTGSGTKPAELAAVPYYAWCHRAQGEMAVWLARTPGAASRPATKDR